MTSGTIQRPLVGDSDAMRGVREYAAKIARGDSTVLLTGETGTGKENLAHFIHANSARRARRFVCINCAALPDGLFEGEMFGYERGAFTGADRAYLGKLALADGGTVLLDEIDELSASAQAKLLRVLESHEVFRLGAQVERTIDIRVIAATNQDLEQLTEQRRFRRDLFFRLNVARVHVPPLRTRCEDIPALIAHYIAEMSSRTGTHIGELAPAALDCLLRYHWPGNVRELRNVVEALFIDPHEERIEIAQLPPNLAPMLTRARESASSERERIVSALCATSWNKCRAAEQLHFSRMTLYRKMAKYGIGVPR